MNQALFIWAVSAYLICLGGSLLLSFFYNRISSKFRTVLLIIHFSLLAAFLLAGSDPDPLVYPGPSNFLFLSFFCLGALISGLFLRSRSHWSIKAYFAVFPLSAIVFFISPSFLIGFISTGDPSAVKPQDFRLYDNVFLVPQQSTSDLEGHGFPFKITMEMGVFHKTLARDIFLPSFPDSVWASSIDEGKKIHLNARFSCPTGICDWDSVITVGQKDSSRMIIRKPAVNP